MKQLCGQKPIPRCISVTKSAAGVETHYWTRSSVKPKTNHQNRLPHSVSSNVSYEQEGSPNSEDDKSPVAKKCTKLRPKEEPSSAQIKADNFVMKPPPVTSLRRSARNIAPKPDTTPDPALNPPAAINPHLNSMTEDNPNKDGVSTNPKGDFKTQRCALKCSKNQESSNARCVTRFVTVFMS